MTDLLPITESQKGLLVVDGLVPTREIYNQIMRFDIDPAVPAPAVTAALRLLVTIQPALRQVFGRLPQIHSKFHPVPEDFPVEQVEAAPGEFEETVVALVRRIGKPPFDLAAGPVYRFGLARATDGSATAVLLCAHHIVGDGVSVGPIVRDLDAVLSGALTVDAIEERRVQREAAFVKELNAQNRAATSDQTVERAEQWAAQLREIPPLVLAPRPNRPAQTDFSGARVSWMLSEQETDLLQQTCKRLSITPFVLLTGIYGTVVARHAGVTDVLVGSPFMARRTIKAFDLCGFFVNTMPVHIQVDWDRGVADHLGKVVRAAVDHCRSNVDVTFNQLVAHVQPDRSTNRNPLFSCMLAMQDTFDPKDASVVQRVSEPGNATAKFDLWLGATPIDGTWLLELEYDRQLIGPAVADGLLASLRTALRRAITDDWATLADLFDDASYLTSLRTDGYPAPVQASTLTEWFEASAASTPDALAIEDATRTMTYAELATAAGRVSGGLAANGVRAGDVVGLALDNLCDTTTAILAVLRLGAAFLPLDSSLPPDRLRYMVEKAGCELVIGSEVLPELASISIGNLTGTAPDPGADAGSPVYVMFTSGSTGQPKAVQMGQRPLLNLAAWQIAALGMNSETRFMQYAPLGFDVSYQEILPTLVSGGTVVSREPADRRDFPAMLRRFAATAVTHVYLPVAALRPLVQCAKAQSAHLPALRYVCVSGEQLLVDDEIREFFVDHPHAVLVNLYGPTETHAVTTHRLSGSDHAWPEHVPIGLPLAGVTGYVVDTTGHLAPVGVPGELYLGGVCPADGYIRDPEITAARFLPDRFAGVPGAVMYRTGDMVVRDENDVLIFLGREDTQVKIRGYRVELSEIEAVANGVAGVRQAVATARGIGADRELVLFLLPDKEKVEHDVVREQLTRTLPGYMVPGWIFDIDLIPTSGTGKTDRDALVALADKLIAEHNVDAAAKPVDYADDLERELTGIWLSILQVGSIERDRPVLEYGAHSLSIFTALAEVQAQYGVAVPLVDFFGSPTIASLANLVRSGQ